MGPYSKTRFFVYQKQPTDFLNVQLYRRRQREGERERERGGGGVGRGTVPLCATIPPRWAARSCMNRKYSNKSAIMSFTFILGRCKILNVP